MSKKIMLKNYPICENQLVQRKFVAIGEIGIDLYWDKTTLEIQKIAFRNQIQLAKKYKLPIVIHCRESFDEIFEVLEDLKKVKNCSEYFIVLQEI
jgi:TatD DNase family protein